MKKQRDLHNLTFDDFRNFATDKEMSKYEKVGFPDNYRKNFEKRIFEDILRKIPALSAKSKTVIDIGCGCSDLPSILHDYCRARSHKLILVDSDEMLAELPPLKGASKIPGEFPRNKQAIPSKADVILAYSVVQYPFAKGEAFIFIDEALGLLNHEGSLLLGDIPNRETRQRFFGSPAGIQFHQEFTKSKTLPPKQEIEKNEITDNFVIEVLSRYRKRGYHVYVLPHGQGLPFHSRREDILIVRP